MFYIEWSDTTTIFDSWYFSSGGQIASGHAGWTGYSSGNRISSVNTAIYYANSTTAHATLATAATGAGTRQSRTCWCFGSNNDSGGTRPYSSKTYSFLALHDGLTVGQSSTFFNLIQTMRKQLGGGYT